MHSRSRNLKRLMGLSLGALGVVYGDIGTSPLYALRECLHSMTIREESVYGILSLIFWVFVLIVSLKYLALVLRADNEGEGGIFALLSLLNRQKNRYYPVFLMIGVIGASLLFGDGILTPAVSVLSAVEGLKIISPELQGYVVPITLGILFFLFWSQRYGTQRIGSLFGPIITFWFFIIALLGFMQVIHHPEVLRAISPYYAFSFLQLHTMEGFKILSGVFLVVTGGEALYADIGHFGKLPIRITWFSVVFPALVLNYFGQGAHLLADPSAINNPFYALAPTWFLYPLVVLAALATVIASQAIISAVFSLVKQAVLLDLSPRLNIVQTSAEEKGQVYIPGVNRILAICTLLLVAFFKSSSALASAYGIAVNIDMLATCLLVIAVAWLVWRWSWIRIISIFSFFLLIDLILLGANSQKILHGGWLPLAFGCIIITLMRVWNMGIRYLRQSYSKDHLSLEALVEEIQTLKMPRIPGTAVFVSDPHDPSAGSLLHHLKINQILHEKVIVLNVYVEGRPFIPIKQGCRYVEEAPGVYRLSLHYGFMQNIHIPHTLQLAQMTKQLPFLTEDDMESMAYFVETIDILVTQRRLNGFKVWQRKLFAVFLHNALRDVQFYHLPRNRTIAIGTYCEL